MVSSCDQPATATRRGPLASLVVAETITMLGSRMSVVAIPWLVLVTTDSPAKMGIAGAASALSYVVASVVGAPLVDRFGMRTVSIASDAVAATVLAVVATGRYGGFWLLVALVSVNGAAGGIGVRAKRVLLAPVAGLAGTPMARVTAVYDGLSRTASLVGASVAGVLVAWRGPLPVILLDAVSFALCAATVATLVRLPAGRDDTEQARRDARKERYLSALRAGFAFLRTDRVLFGLVMIMFVTNMVNQAAGVVLFPLWARDVMGSPVALGLLGGAFAGGAILGNIVFAFLATRIPRYATLAIGYLIGGAPRFFILLLSDDLPVVLAVTFVSGVAISTVNPIYGALLYERVPRSLQARVFGLTGAVGFGGMPLGGLLGGWTVSAFGLTAGLLAASILYTCASLVPSLRYRRWRAMDLPAGTDQPAAAADQPAAAADQPAAAATDQAAAADHGAPVARGGQRAGTP